MQTGQTDLPVSRRFQRGRFFWLTALLAAIALLAGPAVCPAQEDEHKPVKESEKEKEPEKEPEKEGEKSAEPAARRDVTLESDDGLKLVATYYAGTKGKDSPAVILLHGLNGSRKDWAELAPALAAVGLRGPGPRSSRPWR